MNCHQSSIHPEKSVQMRFLHDRFLYKEDALSPIASSLCLIYSTIPARITLPSESFLFIIFIIHNLFLVVNLWYFFNLFITFQIKRNTLLHLINQHFFFYFCNFCISSIGIQLDFFIWCMICKHILNNFYLRFFFSSLKNTIQ